MVTEMNIPIELRSDPCWVVVSNGSKVPLVCHKTKAASPSNKETWADFKTCLNAVYGGRYDGLGYCFHNNGIVGIDIDLGYDDDGFLSQMASDIIDKCHSYTEKSRSGRGFHIILKGNLPIKGANNRNGVEIYQDGRYFIMTGKKMIYDQVISNQDAIDYILDTYFLTEKESSGKVGATIYQPTKSVVNGKLVVEYPEIPDGCRNISLTSYAGQLHTQGCNEQQIMAQLKKVNSKACKPPLDESELQSIVKSVMRYTR